MDPEILYQKVLYLFVQDQSTKYLNFWNYRNEIVFSLKTFLSIHQGEGLFYKEGGVRVCGIAVLSYFWCGVAVIFISKYGIAVFRVQAVCGKFKFYVAVVGEKIVVSR